MNIPRTRRPRNYDSIPAREKKYFSPPKRPDRIWGTPGVCRRLLRNGTAADPRIRSSTPSSEEVKNVWRYTSAAPYVFVTGTG